MNHGVIAGRVTPAPGLVYVRGFFQNGSLLPGITNPRGGPLLHRVETEKDGVFFIPFLWGGQDSGDDLSHKIRFRVLAIHSERNWRGEAWGELTFGPDWGGVLWRMAPSPLGQLLRLTDKKLAKAVKDAMGALKPSADHYCMLGLVGITLT